MLPSETLALTFISQQDAQSTECLLLEQTSLQWVPPYYLHAETHTHRNPGLWLCVPVFLLLVLAANVFVFLASSARMFLALLFRPHEASQA